MTGEAPLIVVDGAGVVVDWSPRARELWQRPASEAVGRTALDMVMPDGEDPDDPAEPGSGASGVRDHEGNPVDLRVRPVALPDGGAAWGVFEAVGETPASGPRGETPDTRNAVFDAFADSAFPN